MQFTQDFVELPLEQLHREAAVMKAEGWRFMQTHAVNADDGIDLYYSFMKEGLARNYKVAGVQKGQEVPSITDMFLAAFVFENEARELFGVNMQGIALDFQGAMYAPAVQEPMTFITPEQKAAREKAAAKAAKAQAGGEPAPAGAGAAGAPPAQGARVFVMTPERQARLDAKMANMSPEKKAKVEAALKARAAEAAQAASGGGGGAAAKPEAAAAAPERQAAAAPAPARAGGDGAGGQAASEGGRASEVDALLEAKIAQMQPDKAAKVRAAMARKGANAAGGASAAAGAAEAGAGPEQLAEADRELASKLSMMDEASAAKVRAAIGAWEARGAASKKGN